MTIKHKLVFKLSLMFHIYNVDGYNNIFINNLYQFMIIKKVAIRY